MRFVSELRSQLRDKSQSYRLEVPRRVSTFRGSVMLE